MRRPHFITQFGLVFCSLVFLGGIEVSTSASSPDLRQSLHSQQSADNLAANQEIFLESGEERDIESGSEAALLTEVFDFFPAQSRRTAIIHEDDPAESQKFFFPQNSRAPPKI